MKEIKWISFTDSPEEDRIPDIKVERSVIPSVGEDTGAKTSLTIHYTLSGAWEGAVHEYTTFEVPGATKIDTEGSPSVPADGIFVALPNDASNVEVRVLQKDTQGVDEEINLAPAPKQFIEEEFEEVYEPDSSIYNKDDLFPGQDFDFIGFKTMEGLKVAHILVYLGQYRPQSKHMQLVQSITLEVSYTTPPSMDRLPVRKPREIVYGDLILGLDFLDESQDFSSTVEDFSGFDADDISTLEYESETHEPDIRGISRLEDVEEELTDPLAATVLAPTLATPIASAPGTVFLAPTLKNKNIIAEYVIITTKSLVSAVEPLKNAKTGWPYYARVVLTDDIQREFPKPSLKEAIRDFLGWATKNWRVPPRFVVLAGDTDTLPIHIYNRGGRVYASDHYYADLTGDLVPELTISRLPSSNANILKQICDYIVRYGDFRAGDWGSWQNDVMLCAYQSSTYETTCDQVASNIKCRYRVIKRYAKNTKKADVIKTLNDGVLFAVYRGHGSKTEWSSSNGLTANDVTGLRNHGKPPFVLNICCQNGWVDDNTLETISETFIRHRKAVAVFASSRNSWTYPNNDFIKYIFDAVMTGHAYDPAAIIRYAKMKMVRNHPTSNYHHDNVVMYNLFGDPTAHVASNVEFFRGDWDMNHDGWKGMLKITRIYDYQVKKQSGYCAPVWSISGTYVGSDTKSYPFAGTIGGFDSNQLGSGSKRSDHKIEFRVRFSAANNQRFIGYIHTWNRTIMSGLTWWSNHPFGWNAKKH